MLDCMIEIVRPGTFVTLEQWDLLTEMPEPWEQWLGPKLPIGTKMEYLGHVAGGIVKARYDGQVIVVHPGCVNI